MILKILSKLLRQTADDIDSGKYNCDEEEIDKVVDIVSSLNTEKPLSKELSCKYLNLSRSTFDTYIRNGWIPKGKKRVGFKELSWTQSELDISCEKIKKMLTNTKVLD